jgi:molybdopterin-containing oxidoreductase family membrane subunit
MTAEKVSLESLGVGRITPVWALAVAVLAAIVGLGVYAYSIEVTHGMISSGLRTIGQGGATWGLYIVIAVYSIGVSFAGISTAALVRLFGLRALEPISRAAELLTLLGLMVGALCILADLGRPLAGLRYLPRYARPASPFFGTFTLVLSGYLFASLVYFYLAGRADARRAEAGGGRLRWIYRVWASGYGDTRGERERHSRASFWLSLFILPLLVVAHSTLGFVFGIQGGRPGWFSALQAPGFVVLAGASGVGLLILIAAALRRVFGEAYVGLEAFRLLGNFMWVLSLTYLYFMVVEELTATYAASTADKHVAHEIVWGDYSALFWATVVGLAAATGVGFTQFVRGRTSVGWLAVAGVFVNVAALLKRFLIVVPSQTHGTLLPYREGHYVPSANEVSVVAGLFALATMLFLLFAKVFPILPLEGDAEARSSTAECERDPGSAVRAAAFWATLLGGLATAVTGFLLSLRVGTLPYLDPVVPFSPVIFILGVMATFYSAAVYETIPPARG